MTFLLTPADKTNLREIKKHIDKAMVGTKRDQQLYPLLTAQRELMALIEWFIVRDM
jgi:hypothetical protein